MRQLVSVVTETSIAYYLDDGDGEAVQQVAQIVNPGLAVTDVIDFGSVITDVLRLNGRKRPTAKPVEAPSTPELNEPEPAKRESKPAKKSPRFNQSWGFTQVAVLDTLRLLGPSMLDRVVDAFGHDSTDRHALNACGQTMNALYKAGSITRESVAPYAPGNPTGYTRARYTAVDIEPAPEPESGSEP